MKASSLGAAISAVARHWSFASVALVAIGCKSPPPTNPFAEPAAAESAAVDASAEAAGLTGGSAAGSSYGSEATMASEPAQLSKLGSSVVLAAVGLGKEMEAAAKGAASRVKQVAAQTWSRESDEARRIAAHAADTAQQIARDATTQAQQSAIASLKTWPIEKAGPVLLLAIAEGPATARRAAAAQLAKRWPPAADFPVDAVAESRATALAELRKLWIAQYGQINDAVVARAEEARALISLTQEQVREAQRVVAALTQADFSESERREMVAALVSIGPPLLPILEAQLQASGGLPNAIYQEVLPSVAPAFEVLARLSSTDKAARRKAAAELAAQAAGEVLPPLAVARLAELIKADNDPEVWRSALAAVTTSAHHSAMRMAYQGLSNPAPQVRAAACLYLAAHGAENHAPLLLRAIGDSDTGVRLAAIRALGSVGTLGDPSPLVAFLTAPDKNVRVEAALSLARLRVERGTAALERLALDADNEIRLRAAQAMGEIADPLFLPALVAMLGDQPPVRSAAMASLARLAGSDVGTADGATQSDEEKVRRWQRWYADRTEVADARDVTSGPK
jgi:HEAT repeat protein